VRVGRRRLQHCLHRARHRRLDSGRRERARNGPQQPRLSFCPHRTRCPAGIHAKPSSLLGEEPRRRLPHELRGLRRSKGGGCRRCSPRISRNRLRCDFGAADLRPGRTMTDRLVRTTGRSDARSPRP
jgi:hypothetical protein